MKNRKNNKTRRAAAILLAAVLSVGTLISCDVTGLTDAIDDFAVIIGLEPINTSANVLITDAKTGELVDANVSITFAGENGEDVIDIYSDPLSEDETNDGILTFGLNNSVSPSESSPARVQLLMEADGYVSASKKVVFAGEGTSRFSLKLVKENDKPQGVTTNESTESTDETGTVQNNFSVAAGSETDAETGISVDVPSGTVFKDAEGNTLTGQLKASATYYDPAEPSAMQSLPFDLEDEEGNAIVLMGAGSFKITDQSGRAASNAEILAKSAEGDGTLTYTIKINTDVIHPGIPTSQAGDKVSVFYYPWNDSFLLSGLDDNQTELKDQEVIALESGGLGVRFNTSEVISRAYVLNNFFFSGSDSYSCSIPSFNINENGHSGPIKAVFSTYGYSTSVTFTKLLGSYDTFIVGRFPNVDINYTFTTSSGISVTGTANICNGVTVDFPAPQSNIIDATVDVSLKCKTPGEVVSVTTIPAAAILYRKSGTAGDWQNADILEWYQDKKDRITGGSFSVSGVEQGANYDFTIKIDTEKRNRSIEITGPEVGYVEELDSGICSS